MENVPGVIILPILILLGAQAFGAEPINQDTTSQDEEDVAELSTITVSGQQESGPKISTKKLLSVAGSGGDPLKAIQALPGVVTATGEDSEPAVRGSSPQDNYYQTDNMPVGYLFHFMGNSIYNPNIIEDFSLKAGAWDAQYSDALGAVIDTKLRDPYQESITTTLDVSFLQAGVIVEGALTENSAFYASWREGLIDWYVDHIDEPDEGIAITQVPKYNDYQLKYQYRLDPNSSITFLAVGARDHITVELSEEFEEAKHDPGLVGRFNLEAYSNSQGITYDTMLMGGTSAKYIFSHKEQDFEFEIGSLFEIVATSDDNRFKGMFETPLNNGDNVRYGFELISEDLKYDMSGLYSPCNDDLEICDPASTGVEFALDDTIKLNSNRVFAAYDYMFTPFWQLTLGATSTNDTYLNEVTFEPRLSSRYELNQNWTLTGAVGKHNQTPRDFFAILEDIGNPDLNMPNGEHYVLGFEYKLDKAISAKVEGYYKNIHDLVISNKDYDAQDAPDELKFINGAQGHAYGLEFLINKNIRNSSDKWYGWMSLAYSKTKRKNNDTGESFTYSYDRPWIVNLVANYQLDKKSTIGFKWQYMSGALVTPISGSDSYYQCGDQLSDDATSNECVGVVELDDENNPIPYLYDPIEGEINSERLPPKHTLDIRYDYQKSEVTNFYVEVVNAYGRRNITNYEYSDDYSSREGVSELETLYSLGMKYTFK